MLQPQDLSDATIAFPARVARLMPDQEEIPDECKSSYGGSDKVKKMRKLFNDLFFVGVTKVEAIPEEGIDRDKAWAHIRCIMSSFEPKHEHKEYACVYLFDKWFKDITWTAGKLKI